MESRDKIVQAAIRVYCRSGFRGATTRQIAAEAGVNEVTLFRIFGSKETLIAEAMQACAARTPVPALPAQPADPQAEIEAWCRGQLAHLTEVRSLIRKNMSDIEEHPDIGAMASRHPRHSCGQLRAYLERLHAEGRIVADPPPATAAAMLLGTLFADVMGRDMMPELYPPAADAATQYTRLFLRAIGLSPATPAAARRS